MRTASRWCWIPRRSSRAYCPRPTSTTRLTRPASLNLPMRCSAHSFPPRGNREWHTLLGKPQVLQPIRIDVIPGMAKVFRNRSTGVTYAVVDSAFFISHLNTIIQGANLRVDALAIALTSNVLLAPHADVKQCCMLGFHTSFDVGELTQVKFVQTFIWASWIDAGILGGNLADVTPMSHEISEWMNN